MMLTETLQLMHMFVSAIKIRAHAETQFPNNMDKIEDNKMTGEFPAQMASNAENVW